MLKKVLKVAGLVVLGVIALAGVAFAYFYFRKPASVPPPDIRVEATAERLARGKHLFEVVANCDQCHSERDPKRFGAPVVPAGRGKGRVHLQEPATGIIVMPNITPDRETGIGEWTDGEKIRAIRDGIGRDGRALFPMMPYEDLRYMSDEDVYSLVAYMNALPPVKNPLPRTSVKFPLSMLIKGAPRPAGNVAQPNKQDKLRYGQYLATMAHCEGCHTPFDRGSYDNDKRLAGGRRFIEGSLAVVSANITPDRETGIGEWDLERFISRIHWYRGYVEHGSPEVGPEKFTVMPWLAFAQLNRDELEAIYAYLRTKPAIYNKVEPHPSQQDGKQANQTAAL